MNRNLAYKLKSLRKENNMSTHHVIKKLHKLEHDYSEQSIYKWEHGDVQPKLEVLIALATIYKCDISYLIEERNLTYRNLTSCEIFLLQKFRNDFLFRSTAVQIMRQI